MPVFLHSWPQLAFFSCSPRAAGRSPCWPPMTRLPTLLSPPADLLLPHPLLRHLHRRRCVRPRLQRFPQLRHLLRAPARQHRLPPRGLHQPQRHGEEHELHSMLRKNCTARCACQMDAPHPGCLLLSLFCVLRSPSAALLQHSSLATSAQLMTFHPLPLPCSACSCPAGWLAPTTPPRPASRPPSLIFATATGERDGWGSQLQLFDLRLGVAGRLQLP